MAHHDLKLFIDFYGEVESGRMTAMNRSNDRNFKVGDTVTMHEGAPSIEALGGFEYTGRNISARISHVTPFGCCEGFVCLSLNDVGLVIIKDANS